MAALGSLLFALVMLITVIPYAFLTLLWSPLPLHWRYKLTVGWPKAMLWVGRWCCGMRWTSHYHAETSIDLGDFFSYCLHAERGRVCLQT